MERPAERLSLSIALSIPDTTLIQPFLAREAGYFEDQNLDVDIQLVGGNVITQVAGGAVDIGFQGLPSALVLTNQGLDMQVLYWALGNQASGFMAGQKDITDPTQCETVATMPEGTNLYGFAELYKDAYGATYDHQVFQDPNALGASLISGQVDCIVQTLGNVNAAVQQGANIIVDPRDRASLPEVVQNSAILEASLFATRETVAEKREAIVRFMTAMQQALRLMRDSTPEEITDLLFQSKDWETQDRAVVTKLLTELLPFAYAPTDGYISDEDWSASTEFAVLVGLEFVNPDDAKWSYEQRVDMSILDEANAALG
ncbi:MAG: ABC transporter substrate-binding protein [Microbacteriaceae bacterium]